MKRARQYIPEVKPSKKGKYDRLEWNRKIDLTCQTDGKGFWSKDIRTLHHKKISVSCVADKDDPDFSYSYFEVEVYFNKKDWDIDKHGLVYTDSKWLKDFRSQLVDMGLTKEEAKDVEYSEQGAQGNSYVHLVAGAKFAKGYFKVMYTKE